MDSYLSLLLHCSLLVPIINQLTSPEDFASFPCSLQVPALFLPLQVAVHVAAIGLAVDVTLFKWPPPVGIFFAMISISAWLGTVSTCLNLFWWKAWDECKLPHFQPFEKDQDTPCTSNNLKMPELAL